MLLLSVIVLLRAFLAYGDMNVQAVNELQKHLFENYNKVVLPRHNASQPIIVYLESYLADLSQLREAENVLEANMYFHITWTDEFLTWNSSEYNITELSVNYDKVWLPDIFMINGLDDSRYLPVQDIMLFITHDGHVNWWPGGNTKTKCKLEVSKYPFDSQLCMVILEPWKASTKEQIFQLLHTPQVQNLKMYDEHADWKVTNLSEVVYVNEFYDYYGIAHYEYRIHLKRRTVYHILNIILPVPLLSIISLCSFLIPPSSGEKMSLCVSIFLSFAVYITVINNELPKTANGICYFGLYLFTQLLIGGFTIILSAVVLHIYHNDRQYDQLDQCKKRKMSSNERVKEVNNLENNVEKIQKNKAFALKLDMFLFKATLILDVVSFVVFLILSNT
ncbi:hypothetical protein FSP39_013251 [Pinctada imbricata]|uniref:Uncharacterized protein n=1 Tax=Pinctada imbricata TaxID=66713 RepID=A0AA88XFB8_PINIB|nr:hypothetical protein FSP39_013251 [Pinctada imbricata]